MPHRPPQAPETAPLLPPAMLEGLVRRGPVLLCLDYDGTISEIVSRPAMARPVEGVVAAIKALAQYGSRVAVAIVSGRPVAELRRMTGLDREVMFSGVHGLEIVGRDAQIRTSEDAAEYSAQLDSVRRWLADNVALGGGFEVEDKGLSVALHYRNAAPVAAAEMCVRFEEFVRANASRLRAAHNKMVVEALPVTASKGRAVSALCKQAGDSFLPVYFGDDRTDEDAFAELAERGVGVLVGEARPTLARWRVDSPADVARILTELAKSLERTAGTGSI